MKKRIIGFVHLFALLFFSLNSFAQAKNEYLYLKGNVGSAPITMHLYKKDNRYSGFYYQEKLQRPVEIEGLDSSGTGKITMTANYKGNKEIFSIDRLDRKFTGFMEPEGSGKPVQVRLSIANPPLKMSFVVVEDSAKLLDLPKEYPLCKVSVQTSWPDNKIPDFEWIKDDIRETLTGVNYQKEEIVPLLKMLNERELKKYKLDYLNISEKELKESYRTFSADIQKNLKIIYHTHRFISFSYREFNYSGGAHGNTNYQFFTLDKESKKKISLNNLFNRTALEDLLPVLEKWYLIEKGLKAGTSLIQAGLFENNISKNPSSCYVTDKGMGFIYNPYMIAPYSSGLIHIFVPYTELTPLINKSFAKSMNWL
jgi:hypothetical protein